MSSGCSGTPLELAPGTTGDGRPVEEAPAEVIVAFFTERAAFERALPHLRAQMEPLTPLRAGPWTRGRGAAGCGGA